MELTLRITVTALLILLFNCTAHASGTVATDEKPGRLDVTMLTVDAVVENIDRETRQVTLKDAEGKSVTLTLDEKAGKIDDIDTGDQVTIEYLESVAIQVFGPGEIKAGAAVEAIVADSQPGEKPAGLVASQISVVVTIEAIDLEKELVTLKGKNGQLKTVTPRHPEALKKVKVGDMVKVTYTEAVGFSVIEKPAAK